MGRRPQKYRDGSNQIQTHFKIVPIPHQQQNLASRRGPSAISLFAGAGGCSLGFRQADFDIRFATDIEPDAVESYRRNFAGSPCEARDVQDCDEPTLQALAGLPTG